MYKYEGRNRREFSAVCRNDFGRKVYKTNKSVINEKNIIEELNHAKSIHSQNAVEITYLNRYYEGDQPILYRNKEIRPEINNKVVMNLAYEAVERHVADMCAEPIQYVLHGTDDRKAEEITKLTQLLDSEDKQECDVELFRWRSICGTAFRFVGQDSGTDVMDESVFSLSAEDPRYTFVAYYARDNKPAFSCQIYENEDGETVYYVYTKNQYFEIVGDEIRSSGVNGNRMIPVIEYPNNSRRLSDIEMTIFITDALNTMASDRVNGIEGFVSSWIKFVNCEVDKDSFLAMRQSGALVVKSNNSEHDADVDVMTTELNQTEAQVAFDDLFDKFLNIQGLANRQGVTGSDTGSAVQYRNGHVDQGLRSAINEPIVIKAERQMLKLILNKLRIENAFALVPSDVEVHINHNKQDNMLVKAEVLEILIRCGVERKRAIKAIDMFSDPEQVAIESKETMDRAFDHMVGGTTTESESDGDI